MRIREAVSSAAACAAVAFDGATRHDYERRPCQRHGPHLESCPSGKELACLAKATRSSPIDSSGCSSGRSGRLLPAGHGSPYAVPVTSHP